MESSALSRSDFTQAAYNVHEHNHIEWSTDRLKREAAVLAEIERLPHRPERMGSIALRRALLDFEIEHREIDADKVLTSATTRQLTRGASL